DLPADVAGLHELCVDNRYVDPARKFAWRDGEAVLNFSKLKGRTLRAVARDERSFLEWMLRGDFAPESKAVAREALAGRFPAPPSGGWARPSGSTAVGPGRSSSTNQRSQPWCPVAPIGAQSGWKPRLRYSRCAASMPVSVSR